MRRPFVTVMFLVAAFSLISGGVALANPKIGYFEMSVVLQKSKAGQRSSEQFKRESETIKVEVDRKAQEFSSARDDFEKKKAVMDDKTKSKRIEELRKMQAETEKLLMDSNARLNKLSNELSSPLVDKIFEIVRKVGRDGKYDFIFEREKAGIVFTNEKEDLTNKIIQELDRM